MKTSHAHKRGQTTTNDDPQSLFSRAKRGSMQVKTSFLSGEPKMVDQNQNNRSPTQKSPTQTSIVESPFTRGSQADKTEMSPTFMSDKEGLEGVEKE